MSRLAPFRPLASLCSAGPSRISQIPARKFGFSPSSVPGLSGFSDEAANPVIRDSLVPIVVEQTVSFPKWSVVMCKLTGIRQEEKGVTISTQGC